MSTKESLNKLVKNITGEDVKTERITEGLKELIKALDAGDKIKPTDDTISELLLVVAEVLPDKIGGGGGITVNESYDITDGTLNAATITLEGDIAANIPNGVDTLGGGAFSNNAVINKVIMPNSVTAIEDGAPWTANKGCFASCTRLKTIVFSNALTRIGDFAFYFCTALTSVVIPNSVTSIGNQAFASCIGLTSIVIPNSVTSIGENAFTTCEALTDIYYTGTQAEWESIEGIADASIQKGATIHYEYTP